eukprot:TRINITY_DN12798_c0_g1_i1.p1 TRINITY_DN12798_c0_g1~~TRINITY_DN12798_c0_g1_i1.p1  ORF type:complete len:177 (-),score=16.33 TRINITY_DN12798_c0_g1_i1:124-654(-)
MPEVHFIGELQGASGFPASELFCKYKFVLDDDNWELLEGVMEGQTQVDNPQESDESVWAHPIDVHLKASSIKGWPKINVQVWHQDRFGRNELYGYGFCHLPTAPGQFDLEIVTWRPEGSLLEELKAYFLGGVPHLRNDNLVVQGGDRYRLKTVPMGKVFLQIGVILKDFAKYGVHW